MWELKQEERSRWDPNSCLEGDGQVGHLQLLSVLKRVTSIDELMIRQWNLRPKPTIYEIVNCLPPDFKEDAWVLSHRSGVLDGERQSKDIIRSKRRLQELLNSDHIRSGIPLTSNRSTSYISCSCRNSQRSRTSISHVLDDIAGLLKHEQ